VTIDLSTSIKGFYVSTARSIAESKPDRAFLKYSQPFPMITYNETKIRFRRGLWHYQIGDAILQARSLSGAISSIDWIKSYLEAA
jgi:hypothetical protein